MELYYKNSSSLHNIESLFAIDYQVTVFVDTVFAQTQKQEYVTNLYIVVVTSAQQLHASHSTNKIILSNYSTLVTSVHSEMHK